MGLDAGGRGGGNVTHSPGARQQVARQVVMRPKPTIAHSAPPSTSSSGSYSGGYQSGGGAPTSTPQVSQGPIGGVGQSGPSPAERAEQRREAIQARREARKEKRQEARKDYRSKRKDYRNYIGADETFQGQKSSLQKQLEDFILSNKSQRGDVREDFGLSTERMGQERERALEQMQADFAARGMLNSSEYLDSVGQYDTDYQTKIGDLTRDRDRSIEELLEGLGMYRRSNREELQNARAEAVRRRAEKFGGWDPSQKPKFMR